jgi:outer membrane protein assembly factor BamB
MVATSHAEDWPQFRGLNASGVSSSTKPLPLKFSTTENLRWSVDLGDGVASPIVCGGRVFATAMSGEQTFALLAFDAASGKQLWKRELDTGKLPRITPPNSPASSTPASDGQRVYVYFSTLGLLAFDAADGKELWRHELPRPAYLMDWGAAGSPIVYRDMVIFNQDDDLAPYLIALDAATGKLRWRTPRPDMLAGYAVPVLCQAGGRTDLVVAGSGKLKGYDPETGKERWTCNTLLRIIMPSPVVKDDVIYVSVQSYGDAARTLKFALLEWLDTNQDGRLARAEVPREFLEKFDQSDKDRNGMLEGAEVDTAFQSPANMAGGGNIIQAVRGGGSGDVTKTHLLWNLDNRAPSNLSSPLVVGDELLVVKKGGLSSCFSSATGKTRWELKRIGNFGEYYASPVYGDGKIYLTGENGLVVVLAAGPELRVLAKNDVGGTCVATPAIAEGRLYFRTREKLLCIGEQK